MGAGQVLGFILITQVGVEGWDRKGELPRLCPCHSQCPLLLLAFTRCW